MDEIIKPFTTLVEAGKKDTDSLTDDAKLETFALARAIRKGTISAQNQVAKLSPEERDMLAMKVGLTLISIIARA